MKTAEELLLEYNETEKELSELNKKVNKLRKQKKQIIANINNQGYLVEDGKLVENKLVPAIEWNLDYNDYYVGEHGMHTIETSGMIEISAEQYDTILEMLETKDDELGYYLSEEILCFSDNILMNPLREANCTQAEDVIHYVWEEEGHNDDTMNQDSFLKIHKRMDMVKIQNSKYKYDAIAP